MKRRKTDRILREKDFKHKWRMTQSALKEKNQDELLRLGYLPRASYDPDRNDAEVRKARANQYISMMRKIQRENNKREPNLHELSLKRLEEQVRLFSVNYDPERLMVHHKRIQKRVVHRLHILEEWLKISTETVEKDPDNVRHKKRLVWVQRDLDLLKGEG